MKRPKPLVGHPIRMKAVKQKQNEIRFFTTMVYGKGLFCHETRYKRTKAERPQLNFVSVPFRASRRA